MSYDRSHRVLEVVAIVTHLALSGVLLFVYFRHAPTWFELLIAPLAIVPAMAGADLASAVVHFAADRFGSTETPVFGRNLIRSFREHHSDPKAMTHHDFITTTGDSCMLTVPVISGSLLFVSPETAWGRFGLVFVLFFVGGVFMTSQVHKWSHMDHVPRVVATLQRWGLFLRPDDHRVHHTAPHDRAYATFTGWLNPLMDEIRFYVVVENTLRSTFGYPRPEETPSVASELAEREPEG